ncbi:universal stress protein [Rhodococcus phenolicus]|uniref:universal stress protein n=1 Tax=Rhodococcus phenolicus TaxID=263849 RepID=UPI00082A5CBA|nr:universal stress protein [Rhodococcus phenolicus]
MTFQNTGTHIVVGIDGSDTSLGAAKWAAAIAGKLGRTLQLVHSTSHPTRLLGVGDPTLAQQLTDSLTEDGARIVSAAVAAARQDAPDTHMTTLLGDEAPATTLLAAAKDASLIVVGATGRGSVERWLLGSTASRVVGRAHCPVVVWRGDPADPGPDTRPVVVGVADGPASALAAESAFDFAALTGAPITAVRTWTDEFAVGSVAADATPIAGPAAMLVDWDAVARGEAARLREFLTPYRQRFPQVMVEEVSSRGSASRELLRALDDAQLAVVGSRGRGRITGALLGSTSQNLLHRAERPVMICRGDGTDPS